MPIITRCEHCSKLLRVSEEHIGKQARCPGCNALYTVPRQSQPTENFAADSPDAFQSNELWYVRTATGQVFGPAEWTQIKQWASEGRVSSTSWLRSESGRWQPAADLLGSQLPGGGAPAQQLATAAPPSDPVANAFHYTGGSAAQSHADHQGVLALVLSILGFFFCFILSIVSLAIATNDLSRISRGEVDPSGSGLLRAAQIISIIHLVLMAFWILFVFAMIAAG